MTHRLGQNPATPRYAGLTDARGRWTGEIRLFPEKLDVPLRWKRSRLVFVQSMGDLFHEAVPFEFIDKVMDTIWHTPEPKHTYLLLTKRASRAYQYFNNHRYLLDIKGSFPHLWLGITVCNQAEADQKIPLLLELPAAVRWVSVEPMLGAVDLGAAVGRKHGAAYHDTNGPCTCDRDKRLDWVVCGGETGPGARPMHPDWARGLRDQCAAAGAPFFLKSLGEWGPGAREWHVDDMWMERIGKRRAGRLLDGQEWLQMPGG